LIRSITEPDLILPKLPYSQQNWHITGLDFGNMNLLKENLAQTKTKTIAEKSGLHQTCLWLELDLLRNAYRMV